MQIDALALRMRPRGPLEAADLGARLTQGSARSLYACYAVAYLPVVALALASYDIAAWLPPVVIFLSKPWLDRTILFVLARAAFGQDTRVGDLWRARRPGVVAAVFSDVDVAQVISVALFHAARVSARGAHVRQARLARAANSAPP